MTGPRPSRRALAVLACCAGALAAACTASALQKPGRSITRQATIEQLALTHASVAFVVGETRTECDHVELWNTDTRGTWRFGKPTNEPCSEHPSTGSGISSVAAAGNRVLWIAYAGGNLRDWQLFTATTTRKTPKQLRFVERDVEAPPPIVIGEGTPQAIPYAVDKEVTYLGVDGAAVFKWTAPANVRAITAGTGPGLARVAALLDTGDVVLLSGSGSPLATLPYQPGAVKAIALAPAGLLAQLPGAIQITKGGATTSVVLPAGSTMLDYAGGRILYRKGVEIHARRVSDGQDTLLLKGTQGAPVLASYDTHGLAWASQATIHWACAGCIAYSA